MVLESEKIFQKFHDVNDRHDAIGGGVIIEVLIQICHDIEPKNVLELGGGKGTLTYTVLKYSNAFVDSYEPVQKFMEIMKTNLNDFEDRYAIIPSYNTLPPKRNYDLIIVDGGKNESEDSFPKAIASYLVSQNTIKTILIEGQRKSQKYWITETIWPFYIYRLKKYGYEKGEKKGVLRIDCVPSRNILKNFLNHLYYRKKIY